MSVSLFARKPHQNILEVTHGLAAIVAWAAAIVWSGGNIWHISHTSELENSSGSGVGVLVAAGYCRGDRVVSSVLVGRGSASPAGRLVGLGSGREVRVGSGWKGVAVAGGAPRR